MHRIYLSGEDVELEGGAFHMALEKYLSNPLWPVLIETVHAMIMYPHHKAFVRDTLLPEQPGVTPQDLAAQMGIPVGESLVILYELRERNKKK